jgi:hypothetical protein
MKEPDSRQYGGEYGARLIIRKTLAGRLVFRQVSTSASRHRYEATVDGWGTIKVDSAMSLEGSWLTGQFFLPGMGNWAEVRDPVVSRALLTAVRQSAGVKVSAEDHEFLGEVRNREREFNELEGIL